MTRADVHLRAPMPDCAAAQRTSDALRKRSVRAGTRREPASTGA
ncbi:hypothetical protein [Streptomyces marispadix]|nr:hypothetical protein [Streptomyces marispadix]